MGVVKITEAADPDLIRTLGRIEGAVSRLTNSIRDIERSTARLANSAEQMARALEKLSADKKVPYAANSPIIKFESMNQTDLELSLYDEDPLKTWIHDTKWQQT